MQTTDLAIGAVLCALELAYALVLGLVLLRLTPSPSPSMGNSVFLELVLIFACSAMSLVGFTHALGERQTAFALVALTQFLCDAVAFLLDYKASQAGLRLGSGSVWRAVLSSVAGVIALAVLTPNELLRGLGLSIVSLRVVWIAIARCCGGGCEVDEVGLLMNRRPVEFDESRIYLEFPDGDDEEEDGGGGNNRDVEASGQTDAMSESLLAFGPPSFVLEFEQQQQQQVPRTSSLRYNASPDLILNIPNNVTWGVISGDGDVVPLAPASTAATTTAPTAATATAPVDSTSLPSTVAMICVQQVLTKGGVPLQVYVLRLDNRRVCVHRYGDFRALHKRFILPLYPQSNSGPLPHFPVRRLARKLLPQALGGYGSEDGFYHQRASELEHWIQAVLELCRSESVSLPLKLAVQDFLRPLVGSGDIAIEGESAVVQNAVQSFSELTG